MKSILRFGCGMLLLAVMFTSCKNNISREAKYIPKEASTVFVLNAEQLQEKLQKGGISTDSLIARMFKDDTADVKGRAEFEELRKNAGIDWEKKWFLFLVQKAHPDQSLSNAFSVMGSVADAEKLETYLKNQEELKGNTIQKEKDYSYMLIKDNGVFAWNKEIVIATFFNHTPKVSFFADSASLDQPAPIVDAAAELKGMAARYFTQKTSESLASEDKFTRLFKEKADGYMFTNTNNASIYLSMLPFQIPKLAELLKDNYNTGTFNFEDGKIVGKATAYPSPMGAQLLKQYSTPTVNLAMLEKYPSASVNGFMLFAVNPQIIDGLLKQLEVEGFVDMALEKSGLNSADIYKAFKGDFALMVSDLGLQGIEPQLKKDEKSMISKKPWGKMIINMPVGDKASFDKVMSKAVENGVLVQTPGGGYKGSPLLSAIGLYIQGNDKDFVIASDSLTYVQYMSGTAKANLSKDVTDKFSGKKSGIMYFDIANTLKAFNRDTTENFSNSLLTAKRTFKDVIATVDAFDGKTIKSLVEMRLQDDNENSLVTLIRLFTDIVVDSRLAAKNSDSKLFPGGVPAIIRTN